MTREQGNRFSVGLSRALGGAVIFSLPLLMTNEMWSAGIAMHPARLAVFCALALPLLVGLAWIAGFESSSGWRSATVEALVACAVAFPTVAVLLLLFGVIGPETSLKASLSAIALQALPAGIGALLARSQLGGQDEEREEERRRQSWGGELFTMLAGGLFLGLNVAPTEEVVQIAYKLGTWQPLLLVVLSLTFMHAFVYAVQFRGQETRHPDTTPLGEFFRLTVVGYVVVLAVSAYILWTFGRLDGKDLGSMLAVVVVLGLPTSVGAAAARLIL